MQKSKARKEMYSILWAFLKSKDFFLKKIFACSVCRIGDPTEETAPKRGSCFLWARSQSYQTNLHTPEADTLWKIKLCFQLMQEFQWFLQSFGVWTELIRTPKRFLLKIFLFVHVCIVQFVVWSCNRKLNRKLRCSLLSVQILLFIIGPQTCFCITVN